MSATRRPAKYGPYHRRTHNDPTENEKVESSGTVWGTRPRNVYAGLAPGVKAWTGRYPKELPVMSFTPMSNPIRVERLTGQFGAKGDRVSLPSMKMNSSRFLLS
jgi:hypothetical protein